MGLTGLVYATAGGCRGECGVDIYAYADGEGTYAASDGTNVEVVEEFEVTFSDDGQRVLLDTFVLADRDIDIFLEFDRPKTPGTFSLAVLGATLCTCDAPYDSSCEEEGTEICEDVDGEVVVTYADRTCDTDGFCEHGLDAVVTLFSGKSGRFEGTLTVESERWESCSTGCSDVSGCGSSFPQK